MPKFNKKPVTVDADQWFKNGDNPDDNSTLVGIGDTAFKSEGKVVRYYRNPIDAGSRICTNCSHIMNEHGWIDARYYLKDHIVCPGDWIIKEKNQYFICKENEFSNTYDPAQESL